MKDPAILFYTSDFITGTLTMTDAQRGKYIILLCLQHQQGYLTEADMLNICKTYDEKIFSKFDKDKLGYYYNERMLIESDKRKKHCEKQKERIQKYWDEKNKENDTTVLPLRNIPLINENEDINENINMNEELYKSVVIFFDEDLRPKTKKQKNDWCDTLDKLKRIDGKNDDIIIQIVKRARMDDFWRNNFMSIMKLRQKDKNGVQYFTRFEKLFNGKSNNDMQFTAEELEIIRTHGTR